MGLGRRRISISSTRLPGGEAAPGRWSTGNRIGGAVVGDRAFLLRQGTHGRGIVASGTVASEIYQDEDWDGSEESANYVDLLWEQVVPVEDALQTEALKQRLPETNWDRLQMSGTFLKPELVDDLEQLWSDQLASLTQNEDVNLRLNAEITDNDVLLFDTGLRLNQHLAELAEARTLLSLVESQRMYGSGQIWDQGLVETLATALEKFTEVTQMLDDRRDVLQQLLRDVRRE